MESIHIDRVKTSEAIPFRILNYFNLDLNWASLMVQLVKNLPATQETWVRSLGWEDPLENGMATHSSILEYMGLQVYLVEIYLLKCSSFGLYFHCQGTSSS